MLKQNLIEKKIIEDRVERTMKTGIELLEKAKGNSLEKEIADYVMATAVVIHNLTNNKV